MEHKFVKVKDLPDIAYQQFEILTDAMLEGIKKAIVETQCEDSQMILNSLSYIHSFLFAEFLVETFIDEEPPIESCIDCFRRNLENIVACYRRIK